MGPVVTRICTRIWQLCAINLTALVLTLAGGIGLGLAPALAATLWATDRLDRSAGDLARGMWQQWRGDFARANLTAMPPMLLALVALIAAPFAGLAAALLLPLAILSAAWTLAALTTLARLSGTAADARANASLAFALAPWRHIAALALVPATLWLAWQQPLLGLYFGLSIPCLVANALIAPALASALPPTQPTEARA